MPGQQRWPVGDWKARGSFAAQWSPKLPIQRRIAERFGNRGTKERCRAYALLEARATRCPPSTQSTGPGYRAEFIRRKTTQTRLGSEPATGWNRQTNQSPARDKPPLWAFASTSCVQSPRQSGYPAPPRAEHLNVVFPRQSLDLSRARPIPEPGMWTAAADLLFFRFAAPLRKGSASHAREFCGLNIWMTALLPRLQTSSRWTLYQGKSC